MDKIRQAWNLIRSTSGFIPNYLFTVPRIPTERYTHVGHRPARIPLGLDKAA